MKTQTTTEDPKDIRDNIPGEPGRDYQAYSSIPKTTFTCEGRAPGFYADKEAGTLMHNQLLNLQLNETCLEKKIII